MPDYTLYGLVVRSDCVLEGLDAAESAAPVDVHIAFGVDDATFRGARAVAGWNDAPVHFRAPANDGEAPGVEVRRDRDAGYWFRYADGTEFTLDAGATRIRARWDPASTLADTATYLLGPVLGFALRLRGVLALHASAVLIDGRAVALVGPSGAGKSTTAAAFAAAGVPVLCDDVLAVRLVGDRVMAYPSYRLLRLWDESERLLFGTVKQLPLLTPRWEKRALPLGEAFPFSRMPAPLGALLLLSPRREDEDAPRLERLAPRAAFMELLANTYANYLLDDRMRAEEMRALDRLWHAGRVLRLVPHADPERLSVLVTRVRAAVSGLDGA